MKDDRTKYRDAVYDLTVDNLAELLYEALDDGTLAYYETMAKQVLAKAPAFGLSIKLKG